MSIYEKQGSQALCTCAKGVCGHSSPRKFLVFRLSETASGAFSGTL